MARSLPLRSSVPRLRRMPGIDGLRAIAVAAVFVYHADVGWLPGGFLGVDVFFVISGYLITSLLLSELDATGAIDLLRFWAGRARRLLPALFTLIGVCLIVGLTIERGHLVELRGDSLASIFYVANWRFIFEHESYFAQFGRPPLLRHLWSLAVEEQFYLVWPPLFLLAMRTRMRRLVPALVAAAAVGSAALMWHLYTPGSDTSRVFYGTDTRAAPILVGVLLAFMWRPSTLPRLTRHRRALDVVSMLALGAVIYAFLAVHDYDPGIYRGGFLVLALCTAVLLATIVHPLGTLGRMLATALPRWIGERSYGIYLWHWPVLAFTRPGVDVRLARVPLTALQAAITVAIAAFSYRFIEQPIRRGGVRQLRLRARPRLRRLRRPAVLTSAAVAALLVLVALTPTAVTALPPGISAAALASAQRTASQLVLPPGSASGARSRAHAHAAPPPVVRDHRRRAHRHAGVRIPSGGPILALGDSVMLGASSAMDAALGSNLHIDAVVARQPETTISRILRYRAEGSLPERVVVDVGDNGPVYYADAQRLKTALAGVPLVVLVNVRVDTSWQGEVNSELRQTVASWHQATIADWYDASARTGLLADGTHPTPQGARIFAALIARAIHSPKLGGVTR